MNASRIYMIHNIKYRDGWDPVGFAFGTSKNVMECDTFAFDFVMLQYKGPLTKASKHEEAHVH